MAKRRKMTIPIGIAAPLLVMGVDIGTKLMNKDLAGIKGTYTGVWEDGRFNMGQIVQTYAPLAAGAGIHVVASKTGVNRAIGQARIPLLRL